MSSLVKYGGSCHCGDIKFEVLASKELLIVECNCSLCTKKQSRYFIVSSSQFKLVKGHTSLTTYTFGTHQAKHSFCSKCGVESFYIPSTHPDGIAVISHCLDSPTPSKIRLDKQNGKKI